MTSRIRVQIALAGALLVNLILFALLPGAVGTPKAKMDLESLNAVNLVEIKRQTPPPPEKEQTPEEKPPPEPPKPMPDMAMQQSSPDIPKMDMVLPNLSFEINPKLATGMAVAAPPSGPAAVQIAAPSSFGMDEVDQVPVPLSQLKPVYPQRAKRMRLNGKVDVRFLVSEGGTVSNIEILGATPEGVFDDSVRKALAAWKFTPGKKNGAAVRTWFVTSIEFKFEG